MLVLSRLAEEKIVIRTAQGDLTVTVVEVRRGKVRLGFQGGKEFFVIRQELLEELSPGRVTSDE